MVNLFCIQALLNISRAVGLSIGFLVSIFMISAMASEETPAHSFPVNEKSPCSPVPALFYRCCREREDTHTALCKVSPHSSTRHTCSHNCRLSPLGRCNMPT